MNRINGYVTQHPEAYEYYIEWEEFNFNYQNSTNSIRATSYIKCNNHRSNANNKTQKLWIAGREFSNTLNINLSPGTTIALVSATVDNIPHNWDGSLNIEIAASGDLPSGSGYGPLWGEARANVWLTQIPRQANFTAVDIQNATLEHFDVYYNLDKTVDAIQYKLDNGNWQNITPYWGSWNKEATFAVQGLTPNTNYTIQLKATVNGIDSYSSVYRVRTLDIAKFTNLNDFFFGDVINITKTNESNWWNYLTVKVGNTVIAERRKLESNNLTFTFTQEELDKLYKALTSFNKTTVEFILITNNEYQDWTSSKKVQCTFNGKQKTINYYIADQVSKRAQLGYYIADGVRKNAVILIKKNGKWRKCL